MKSLCIAICTFNRHDYLHLAINSILRQTYSAFSLIILDNASTDNTKDMVLSIRDPRVSYIRHKENIGAIANCNYILKKCDTDFLLITHDDDLMEETMIEREIEIFNKYDDISIVSTNMKYIDTYGKTIPNKKYLSENRSVRYSTNDYIRHFIKHQNKVATPTAMLRMSAINKMNIEFNPNAGPGCDALLWSDINSRPNGNIFVIGDDLYKYRIHDQQDSSQNILNIKEKLYTPYCDLLKKNLDKSLLLKYQRTFALSILGTHIKLYLMNKSSYEKARNGMIKFKNEHWESFSVFDRLIYIAFINAKCLFIPVREFIKFERKIGDMHLDQKGGVHQEKQNIRNKSKV